VGLTSAQECTSDGQKCDTHERCRAWKAEGECFKNAEYMAETCPASCADEDYPTKVDKVCKDYHLRCPVWAELGECTENPTNMRRYCPLSCEICKDPSNSEDIGEDDALCVDMEGQCSYWASRGECSANPAYMHTTCAKSCGTCEIIKKKEKKKADPPKDIALTKEEKKLIALSAEIGERQKVSGAEAPQTIHVIQKTLAYMNNDVPSLPTDVQDKW
jgi:hypothetical protein